MTLFTIKDLENLSGIKAHTIRMWEQRYSLLKPKRTETNIRFYTSNELRKILSIALLNKCGYKISHINAMNDGERNEKIRSLEQSATQEECIINNLIHCMLDLDGCTFEKTLNKCIKTHGLEKTITDIIFLYLERTGILWLTSHINPAQEHLVTNIIRQKLITGIDNIRSVEKTQITVLVFLPEGEYHELGLLFIQYLLKAQGISSIYLGCSVPIVDLAYVAKQKRPRYLISHLTTLNADAAIFIQQILKKIPKTPLIISGKFANENNGLSHRFLHLKKSLAEMKTFIHQLK